MRFILGTLFFAVLMCPSAKCQFKDGQELLEWSKCYQAQHKGEKCYSLKDGLVDDPIMAFQYTSYIFGVVDSMLINDHLTIPDGVMAQQLFAIVDKYLATNPARLHYSAAVLVMEAMNEAFPPDQKRRPLRKRFSK